MSQTSREAYVPGDMTRGSPARHIILFALPMMVGVVVGCYSSICIAAPLYTVWTVHRAGKKTAKK